MPRKKSIYEFLEREFPEKFKAMVEEATRLATEEFAKTPDIDILHIPVALPFHKMLPSFGIFCINRKGGVIH